MPTGLDHVYTHKEEHVMEIRFKVGDIVRRRPNRADYGPVLFPSEKAEIVSIYDMTTEAADGSGPVTDTIAVVKVVFSHVNSVTDRHLEDRIENLQPIGDSWLSRDDRKLYLGECLIDCKEVDGG